MYVPDLLVTCVDIACVVLTAAEYDLRKAEVFINNRGGNTVAGSPQPSFTGWELYRQVSQAARQGDVYDYLACNRFDPITSPSPATAAIAAEAQQQPAAGTQGAVSSTSSVNKVRVTQRVGAFLQPQDPQFFATGGKAVAVYDYEYTMSRLTD